MSLIRSNGFFQSRKGIYVVLAGLVALYLVSRTAFLLRLPPFIDEATHLLWAHEMLEGNLAAGAYDGRWATIQIFALVSLLPLEPLLAGRIVVVIAGLFTMFAIIFSGKLLFSMKEGLLAGLIYVALPFALFYDRLGLADGLSLAFGAWTLFISIKTVRSDKGYYSVLLTITLIGAILTKTSGIISILFPVLAVGFLLPRDRWKIGVRKVAPAVIAGLLIAFTLWLRGAGSSGFFEKTSGGLLIDPAIIPINSGVAASWYWSLLTPMMAIISVLALIWLSVKQGTSEIWFLESILLITLLPNILLYKIW
jgi:4-amino-4-deoxy-L-arabinose transferase-like glycosyltransferase